MRVATLAEVKNYFTKFIKMCEKEPIVVTRNGKIAAVLEHMTDDKLENYLLERSKKFNKMLDGVKKQKGGMDLKSYRKAKGIKLSENQH